MYISLFNTLSSFKWILIIKILYVIIRIISFDQINNNTNNCIINIKYMINNYYVIEYKLRVMDGIYG